MGPELPSFEPKNEAPVRMPSPEGTEEAQLPQEAQEKIDILMRGPVNIKRRERIETNWEIIQGSEPFEEDDVWYVNIQPTTTDAKEGAPIRTKRVGVDELIEQNSFRFN